MILLLSYDLDHYQRPKAYEAVKDMVEENSIGHLKVLYSQWLIETNESPDWWSEKMKEVADTDDDYWFIVQVERPYQGWLPKSTWSWLRSRV